MSRAFLPSEFTPADLQRLAEAFETVKTLIDAIPTVNPADGVTIWNDGGVLKVASAA